MDIFLNYFCNMSSNNSKTLKDRVKAVMKERNVSVLELSRQTGIPSPRIYKWYQSDTNPKLEDAEVLESWIKGESLEETPSMVEEKEVQFAPLTRSSLEKSIENLTENELRTTAVIERLVGLLERSMSSVPPGKEPLVQTPADTQAGGQRVVQDLALDKRYSKQKK